MSDADGAAALTVLLQLKDDVVSIDLPHASYHEFMRCATKHAAVAATSSGTSGESLVLSHFEYTDDEGDVLSVKTVEDFDSMIRDLSEGGDAPWLVQMAAVYVSPMQLSKQHSLDVPHSAAAVATKTLGSSTFKRSLNPAGINPSTLHILRTIGTGQFGTVYKAVDPTSGITMAMKSVPMNGVSDELYASIISEMEICQQCAHANIVDFYAALFMDGTLGLCFGYMDGGSLERYGRLAEPALAAVSVSVLDALTYLWHKKIIHRDIKPSNILVDSAGRVKLCDFGISRQVPNSVARSYVGTGLYMAPERLAGAAYTALADVWSFGLTLLQMALGRYPYSSVSAWSDSACSGGAQTEVANWMLSVITVQPDWAGTLSALGLSADFIEFALSCVHRGVSQRATGESLRSRPFYSDNAPANPMPIAQMVAHPPAGASIT